MGKAAKKTVWVLTREINDYNQDGSYFEAVFDRKPSVEALVEHFYAKGGTSHDGMAALRFVLHVRGGGGRMENENEWFNLEEVDLKGGGEC